MLIVSDYPCASTASKSLQEKADALTTALVSLSQNPDIIVVAYGPKADKRFRPFKELSSFVQKIYTFDVLKPELLAVEVKKWANDMVSLDEATRIVSYSHEDAGRAFQLTQQVISLKKIFGTSYEWERGVYKDMQSSVFDFLDIVFSDQSRAIRERNHLHASRPEYPMVMGAILRGLKSFLMTKYGVVDGLSAKDIAGRSGLHPFSVSKLYGFCKKETPSLSAIHGLYHHFLDMDQKIKTGQADESIFWYTTCEQFFAIGR